MAANRGLPKPFLKWAGGKSRLAETIVSYFPKKFHRYHEPFLGGGAVFFKLRPKYAVLSDTNQELINAYRTIRDNPAAVLSVLKQHKAAHNKKFFQYIRSLDPRTMNLARSAARMIYLNKTCFNGLYRLNSKGLFNVPFGDYKNPTIVDEENLLAVSNVLRPKTIKLFHTPADAAADMIKKGDLVYFDPPYHGTYSGYTPGGFHDDDQKKLAAVFSKLTKRGVHTFLTNSNTKFVRGLYAKHRIVPISASTSVAADPQYRGDVKDLLIIGEK